jgi:hypothetical protein
LDKAAGQIRDLGLEPEKNVCKIGEAIASASDIRNEIYSRRPGLGFFVPSPKAYEAGA